jgi:hypothetical protein
MNFGRRQALGVAGMVLAIAGGVAWFYGQMVVGIIAWAAAFVLVLRLNKSKGRSRRA